MSDQEQAAAEVKAAAEAMASAGTAAMMAADVKRTRDSASAAAMTAHSLAAAVLVRVGEGMALAEAKQFVATDPRYG